MSVLVTQRPGSDTGVGTWTLVGPSVAAALSDNSNGTSIAKAVFDNFVDDNISGKVTFVAPTIPAGARIEWLAWRLLMSQSGAGVDISIVPGDSGGDQPGWFAVVSPDGALHPWNGPAVARDPRTGADWVTSTEPWTVYFIAGLNDLAFAGYGVGVTEAYLDVSYRRQGSTIVTSPTEGASLGTSRPSVSWTAAAPDNASQPQAAYMVRAFDSATFNRVGFDPMKTSVFKPAYDSGVVANPLVRVHTLTKSIPSDTYRIYVFVSQPWSGTAGKWWSNDYVTVSIDLPVPTPTLTAVSDGDSAQVRLSLDDETDPTAGWMTAASLSEMFYEVQRSADNGQTWVDVREITDWAVTTADQRYIGIDYEAPFHTVLQYRARQTVVLVDGSSGSSPWCAPVETVLRGQDWWLKQPLTPDANRVVNVANATRSSLEGQGVFEPLGRPTAVIVSDGVKAERGELTIRARDPEEKTAIDAMLADNPVFLLQSVLGDQWYVRVGQERKWTLVRAQPLTLETSPIRSFHELVLPWTEVDSP